MATTYLEPFQPQKPDRPAQMELVLEILNEGVVIANRRHQILFANSRFLEITGIPRENLIGNDTSQFYSTTEFEFLKGQWEVFSCPQAAWAVSLVRQFRGASDHQAGRRDSDSCSLSRTSIRHADRRRGVRLSIIGIRL